MLNKQSAEVISWPRHHTIDHCWWFVRKNILRAIVRLLFSWNFLPCLLARSISEFVACVERALELHTCLREMLLLILHLHVVVSPIAKNKPSYCPFLISSRCACQTIQWVTVTMAHLSALPLCGSRRVLLSTCGVVAVGALSIVYLPWHCLRFLQRLRWSYHRTFRSFVAPDGALLDDACSFTYQLFSNRSFIACGLIPLYGC